MEEWLSVSICFTLHLVLKPYKLITNGSKRHGIKQKFKMEMLDAWSDSNFKLTDPTASL